MLWPLAAVLLLAAPECPAQGAPRCADQSAPSFTGHPFEPFQCPESAPPPEEAPPQPNSDLKKKGAKTAKDKLSPELLLGRWEGLAIYGSGRFLVYWDIRKAKGGGFEVEFTAEDYRTHLKHKILASLSPKVLKGHFAAKIRLHPLPETLKADVRFGEPAAPAGQAAFDRSLSVAYRGRAQPHHALFAFAGKDVLRYEYRDLARPSLAASGELRRAAPR